LAVVVLIVAVLVVAAGITVWLTAGRSRGSATGSLSRETRKRDDSDPEVTTSTSTELEATGRERADETRASHGGLMRRRGGEVVEYEPVDEEELGVTRRQFLNRGLLASVAFAAAATIRQKSRREPAARAFIADLPLRRASGCLKIRHA
jgi:hypothetical protein